MKTLTLLLLVTLFASCNKCKDCTTTTVVKTTGISDMTSESNFEACGSDIEEVNGKTVVSTSTIGGITSTATSKTKCY